MRALGVDLGTRRIGLALSDSGGLVATPLEVLERCGSEARDHAAIAEVAAERDVAVLVVGLPISLDGSMGPAARAARAEIARLEAAVGVPVETCDERFSTAAAEQRLDMGEVRGPKRRQVVDMVAAAVLLQSWLDARRRQPRAT
ncbi:MAG: Holliday junction resolvase RuvX [bacterium]|nr:Holliday junction resolvase RuvX [bacterium]MCY3925161.1 Holliday junction resolvase RuvX [bacterium]